MNARLRKLESAAALTPMALSRLAESDARGLFDAAPDDDARRAMLTSTMDLMKQRYGIGDGAVLRVFLGLGLDNPTP